MSDESSVGKEIPVEDDDVRGEAVAIDRDGPPRVVLPVGAALSVLWWADDERNGST